MMKPVIGGDHVLGFCLRPKGMRKEVYLLYSVTHSKSLKPSLVHLPQNLEQITVHHKREAKMAEPGADVMWMSRLATRALLV